MFEQIAAAKPGFLVFPASGQSVAWFVSARSSPLSSASLMRPSARCSPPCRKQSALNVGIIALAANIVALVVVSAVSGPRTVSVGAT